MDHNDIRHSLSEYIDNALAPEARAAVEAHLATCRECNDALAELKKTIEQVKAIEEVEPPLWMTQKIMANVRQEAEKKESWLARLFAITMPVRTIAVLFLAIGAFYIYRNIQPGERPAEAPPAELAMKQEAAPALSREEKTEQSRAASPAPQAVPQKPQFKALEMKLEYEKPAPPVPAGKPSPAPAKAPSPASDGYNMTADKMPSARQESGAGGATVVQQEPPVASKETALHDQRVPVAKAKKAPAADQAATAAPEAPASAAVLRAAPQTSARTDRLKDAGTDLERVVAERFANDRPKLITTYRAVGSAKTLVAEERFNENGVRDGLQKEFYETGQLKTEAFYKQGTLDWHREYQLDGTRRTGHSAFDWIWLKK